MKKSHVDNFASHGRENYIYCIWISSAQPVIVRNLQQYILYFSLEIHLVLFQKYFVFVIILDHSYYFKTVLISWLIIVRACQLRN